MDEWDTIKQLFEQALELPEGEYLDNLLERTPLTDAARCQLHEMILADRMPHPTFEPHKIFGQREHPVEENHQGW